MRSAQQLTQAPATFLSVSTLNNNWIHQICSFAIGSPAAAGGTGCAASRCVRHCRPEQRQDTEPHRLPGLPALAPAAADQEPADNEEQGHWRGRKPSCCGSCCKVADGFVRLSCHGPLLALLCWLDNTTKCLLLACLPRCHALARILYNHHFPPGFVIRALGRALNRIFSRTTPITCQAATREGRGTQGGTCYIPRQSSWWDVCNILAYSVAQLQSTLQSLQSTVATVKAALVSSNPGTSTACRLILHPLCCPEKSSTTFEILEHTPTPRKSSHTCPAHLVPHRATVSSCHSVQHSKGFLQIHALAL